MSRVSRHFIFICSRILPLLGKSNNCGWNGFQRTAPTRTSTLALWNLRTRQLKNQRVDTPPSNPMLH